MHVSDRVITGSIYSEKEAMIERAKRIATRSGKPVMLRSYTFDGFGRRTKRTCYEGHIMPDGSRVMGPEAEAH